jgi:hypothetical protein
MKVKVSKVTVTDTERERYGSYVDMPAFSLGFRDYEELDEHNCGDGVAGQAYDRGRECAMRREGAAPRAFHGIED